MNLNYSSAKTILHLYRKKIKKPKIEENSAGVKRCPFSEINLKNHVNPFEVIATQGGRDLKDLFFTQRAIKIGRKIKEKAKIVVKEEPKLKEEEGRSFVEKFLFYKEMETKFIVKEMPKIVPKIEEKTSKTLFRKAIIIKAIDPLYLSNKCI